MSRVVNETYYIIVVVVDFSSCSYRELTSLFYYRVPFGALL